MYNSIKLYLFNFLARQHEIIQFNVAAQKYLSYAGWTTSPSSSSSSVVLCCAKWIRKKYLAYFNCKFDLWPGAVSGLILLRCFMNCTV